MSDINDRDGVGKSIIRGLDWKVVDADCFQTVTKNTADGLVMLKTKGGMPEVTLIKNVVPVVDCVKGPLTEINFKYNATQTTDTGPSGYRRWYGEPHPVAGLPTNEIQYEWSSDGLLCIETRKLNKISFLDSKGNAVDLLLCKKPPFGTNGTPADTSHSTARFRFTEGAYSAREWYKPFLADIGWAFSGPTIEGVSSPEPASAVKFFTRRLRSLTLTVTDALAKIQSSVIKWVFLNETEPVRATVGSHGCVNKSARELTFDGREFITPNTAGNMANARMQMDIDQPPANPYGPEVKLIFKKPGSLIAAIDPEKSVGKTRPADVSKAIDLMEISAFGNPYHGLVWWDIGGTPVFYKDGTKTTAWGFTPITPDVPVGMTLFSGNLMDHKYYNFKNVDPMDEVEITRTTAGEVLYLDAFIPYGQWFVKDADFAGWGSLNDYEHLYKDPAGTVWVLSFTNYYDAGTHDIWFYVHIKRRYGVLGTDWRNGVAADSADRLLCSYSVNLGGAYAVVFVNQSPDGTSFVFGLRDAQALMLRAWVIDVTGTGDLKTDVPLGLSEGAGISATSVAWSFSNTSNSEYEPVMEGSQVGTFLGLTHSSTIENATFVCGTRSETSWHTDSHSVTYTPVPSGGSQLLRSIARTLLDIQWVEGRWAAIEFLETTERKNSTEGLGSVTPGVKTREQTSCEFFAPSNWVASFTVTETFLSYEFIYSEEVITKRTAIVRAGEVVGEWYWVRTKAPTVTTVTYISEFSYTTSSTGGGYITSDPSGWGEFGLPRPTPLSYCPRKSATAGGGIPPPQNSPLAWSAKKSVSAPTATGQYPLVPVVYRDGIAYDDLFNTQQWVDAESKNVSSRIGWAYDYRTKQLITVPVGSLAYFI